MDSIVSHLWPWRILLGIPPNYTFTFTKLNYLITSLIRKSSFYFKTTTTLEKNQISFVQDCLKTCSQITLPNTNLTCCETNNCNNVSLTPKVSSCYVGGTGLFNVSSREITKNNCVSPRNQFCVTNRGTLNNTTINAYYCSDTCFEGKDNDIVTSCCQNDNCNTPEPLSCIKSPTYSNDFFPKSVTCSSDQTYCLVIWKKYFFYFTWMLLMGFKLWPDSGFRHLFHFNLH